jgi:periplasmic protein TonB
MFEDATFHSSNVLPSQTPKWMLFALAFNLSVLSAMVALPLIYPEGLPIRLLQSVLYAPAPPLAAQPRPRSVQPVTSQAPTFRNPFTAPPRIPILISMAPDSPPPASTIGMDSFPESVPGAISSTDSPFHSNPPVVVHPPQVQRIAISGGVTEGLLIFRTTPAYPAIAKAAGVSGTLVLAAIISKAGAIENLRVVSGPAMLRNSAIEAVQNWRYRPYLLNGQPVEVETTIHVVFSMGNR